MVVHLQAGSQDEPGREVSKLAGLNKDDVFFSHLYQKNPQVLPGLQTELSKQ